ncbi:MAG: PAS domain-containing protein, partial [Gammaproteobacteria bacterium]
MSKVLQKYYYKQLSAYIAAAVCMFLLSSGAIAKDISIAVLAPYGESYTQKAWQPTIDYLQIQIPEHQFKLLAIEPSNVDRLKQMVVDNQIDFAIIQPVTMTELQLKHEAIAVLSMSGISKMAKFGSVIISNADSNITSVEHIKDRIVAGATPTGLGGWLIGYNEINNHSRDIIDLESVKFLGVQDNIVNAVLDRSVDVGIVRTGTLERMVDEKKIRISDFNIIQKKEVVNFPQLLSTALYPEWALAKVKHIPTSVAKKITSSLLNMKPGSKEAVSGNYWEWVPPLDYHPIRRLMMDLNIGEYMDMDDDDAIYHFKIFIQNNVASSLALIILLTTLFGLFYWIVKLNNKLKKANFSISQENETILNSVSEGIYGVDLDGNCSYINKSLTNILGWDESDMIGKHQHEIMHHTHADGTPHLSKDCPVYATFQDGVQKFIDEDMFWKKDGGGIYVEYSANPIKNKTEEIIGSVVVFRDITKEKHSEKYMQELERSSRLNVMGEMVTEIAHELNQPLTAIATNSFSISKMIKSSKKQNNDQYLDILNSISKQAEYAGNIIRNLRKISQKDQDKYSRLDVNKNIKNSILLLESLLKKHRIKLNLDLSSKLPGVKIQSVQIDQVIINLCKNAIESMVNTKPNDRILHIKSEADEEFVSVKITD